MTAANDVAELKRRGSALGFAAIGIAPVEPNPHADQLDRWLEAGYAGTMTYLHRQAAKRKDPRLIMPEAKVAVVTLTDYCHAPPDEPSAPARVAQYAWSRDYHQVLGQRLERLAAAIRELWPGAHTRCYVDAGPVPERELAQRAGLGWIGKNTMLINPELGSFTFLGVVLTDAPLPPDPSFAADRCGTCRACLDTCPTGAFVAPHLLDARRCISYLTIEHCGAFTQEQEAWVGDWLFGCDICQDVCPWNVRFARPTEDPDLAPLASAHPDPNELISMDEATFDHRYAATPFTRAGYAGMRRNAAAVRANHVPRRTA